MALDIALNTTSKFYHKQALKTKLKLLRRAKKYLQIDRKLIRKIKRKLKYF